MRRFFGIVLACLVAALAAPPATAAPAKGEVVIVADGSAYGTVTVPAKVTLDVDRATVETKSPYYLLGAYQLVDEPTLFTLKTPTSTIPYGFQGWLDRGRSAVRVLTGSKVTFRIPATGVRGRLTIRLTRPLTGGFAKAVDATNGVNAAYSQIPFSTTGKAVVAHGYATPEAVAVARKDWLCVGAGTGQLCDDVTYLGETEAGGTSTEILETFLLEETGPRLGKLRMVDAGVSGPVTHFLMVMPVA